MAPRLIASAAGLGLLGLAAANNQESSSGITSIQKVLDMMGEMKAKGIKEKEEEAVKFSAFNQWCGDQTRIKNNEISAGNQKIEELNASIEKSAAEIRKLTDRIEELEEDNGRWTKDKKAATAVREKEAIDFKATVLDYTESIDALNGAIAVLKKRTAAVAQADFVQTQTALLQVSRQRLVPDDAKAALAAYLQQPSATYDESAMPNEMMNYQAPEAAGYEFQSGGVVSMLENLLDEFSSKKTELEKSELEAQHGFEQIAQQLTDNVETATQEIGRKTKRRAETEQAKADAEADLAQTTTDRDEDQKYLDEMTVLCQQKSADFEARQELRAGEIEAISKAIEIIGSESVAGAGEKNLPSFAQVQSSLVQLRSGTESPVQARAVDFLSERAKATNSRLLSEVAAQAAGNPFGKVKKLIKDLISKLMEEATAETEHKGWCDAELSKNKIQRNERSADVAQLTAESEDLTAEIAQLTQDVADLTAAIKELDEAVATATEDRTAAKAKAEQVIEEAQGAQTAVKEAMAVLKEFYAKAATATALVQQPAADAPETFDKPYTGMLPEGGNIVDFLEVILSDFARLESETAATEATEAKEYDNFMFESKKDKALKENEIKHKNDKKSDKEGALHSASEELKANADLLEKANAYYEKLKPDCVDSGINYEDRVKAREAEMQSLEEALNILQGQDLPTLR